MKSPAQLMLGSLVGFLILAGDAFAAAPSGRDIYRKQCASCHGKTGDGVKGEYEEALHGDWAIERLVRYVHKSMPEDKPKSLSVPEAEAVSRYIYDEFYTIEARLKKNPPREELLHLSNRQYVHTVADLLKSFTGADALITQERGLRGNYRSSGRDQEKKISIERVDRAVEFDFFAEGANPLLTISNAVNVEWRGALIAEETGDYEFIIKTPNGARLWVNAHDDLPLIDAGVASGSVDEHKATLRLLGGRAYPIRLEWFKAARDKLASVTFRWTPPHGATGTIPARCLTPARVAPTYVVSTPFPADDSSAGYERGVQVSKAWDDATTRAALDVANHVATHLDRLAGTKADAADRAAKVQVFCEQWVTRAFRRPLTAEEKRRYVAGYFQKGVKLEDSARRVTLLSLKSPRFLFPAATPAKPDDYDVASRLALGLWDSLPDETLLKLASQGALRRLETVRQQAERMLGDPRTRAKLRAFLHHWLQLDRVETLEKDPALFPGFTPEIIADLRTSLNLFLDDVIWSDRPDYRRLLRDEEVFVNDRLAAFYGLQANAGGDFVKTSPGTEARSGVLTHPYLLAAFSYAKSTSPIHRGVFLTRNIVGRVLRPPPEAVAFKEEDFPENLTMREKITALTRSDSCQSCHAVINPLGFSLEHFDAVGRYRTQDGDRPVDAVSEYLNDDGAVVRLTGARDVAEFAIGSEFGQRAFIEQLFQAVVKQPALAYGPATVAGLREKFVRNEFNIQKLLVDIAVISAARAAN